MYGLYVCVRLCMCMYQHFLISTYIHIQIIRGYEPTRLWMRARVDVRVLVSLSGPGSRTSSPCWERLEFPFVVWDPTDLGQRNSCPRSSKCRALHIPDANHLPLCIWVLNLVCVLPPIHTVTIHTFYFQYLHICTCRITDCTEFVPAKNCTINKILNLQ